VQNAFRVVQESVAKPEPMPVDAAMVSRVMAELGRRGGLVGGKKRAAGMPAARRREIALKAARARWDAPRRPSS
jgi:hypothetical protein